MDEKSSKSSHGIKTVSNIYKGYGRFTDVEADESTNEIQIIFKDDFDAGKREFGEEILIYTYGDNPRCYVEGCEILEETK
jgi:hypothetical protein